LGGTPDRDKSWPAGKKNRGTRTQKKGNPQKKRGRKKVVRGVPHQTTRGGEKRARQYESTELGWNGQGGYVDSGELQKGKSIEGGLL